MTADDSDNERLRRAFESASGSAPAGSSCPGHEEIWLGARGELEPARRREFMNHLLVCEACAQSCSIANDLISQEPDRPVADTPAVVPGWLWIAMPAAAMLVVGLVWIVPFDRFGATAVEEFRELDAVTIDSLLDESISLSRDHCELRWNEGPEGALYSVVVSSERLKVLARADELDQASYVVPAAVLAELPAGETFLWRVEALLPDATRVSSPVFRAKLE